MSEGLEGLRGIEDALLDETALALKREVRRFVREEVPAELLRRMDREEIEYPREYVRALGRANLLGVRFPRELGGRGLPWTAETAALEEVGVLGTALACAFSMPSIVGEALWRFGTPEQQERFLRPLLRGELVAAEALTEPRGGSDFFGATTRAELRGDRFVVNGQKRFVVGAKGADFFLVYCNTNPEGAPHERISLLLIERDRGVEVGHVYGLMGTRGGGTGRIVFRNLEVPRENLVGELNQGAEIFNSMMIPERLTSAGGAVGMGRAALEVAARYSHRRHAFGRPIRRYQAVSFKVADAVTRLDAARALVHAAAAAVDRGLPSRRIVSEAKRFATDVAWDVVNLAMQIMGGIGYTNIYPIERMVRDTRLIQIWTGTNEIMSLLIQHEYYKELLDAPDPPRMIEQDAEEAENEAEKVFRDEEMWIKGW
jgi:alkylation response protein AidB-like acyl-CoA dehydrogenase